MRPPCDDSAADEHAEPQAFPAPLGKVFTASAARCFHLENQSKAEISEEFGINRFEVAGFLDATVAHGIVPVAITVPGGIDAVLFQAVAKCFGLRHAVVFVVPRGRVGLLERGDSRQVWRRLGAAARLVREITEEGDALRLDGSRPVEMLGEAVSRLSSCDVIQLTGARGPDLARDAAATALRDTAAAGGGEAMLLYAPLLLSNASAASVLRSRPAVAGTLNRFGGVTEAVVGIDSCGGRALPAVRRPDGTGTRQVPGARGGRRGARPGLRRVRRGDCHGGRRPHDLGESRPAPGPSGADRCLRWGALRRDRPRRSQGQAPDRCCLARRPRAGSSGTRARSAGDDREARMRGRGDPAT